MFLISLPYKLPYKPLKLQMHEGIKAAHNAKKHKTYKSFPQKQTATMIKRRTQKTEVTVGGRSHNRQTENFAKRFTLHTQWQLKPQNGSILGLA